MASTDQIMLVDGSQPQDPEPGTMKAMEIIDPSLPEQQQSVLDRFEAILPGSTRIQKWTLVVILAALLFAITAYTVKCMQSSKKPCPDGYVEITARRLMEGSLKDSTNLPDCMKAAELFSNKPDMATSHRKKHDDLEAAELFSQKPEMAYIHRKEHGGLEEQSSGANGVGLEVSQEIGKNFDDSEEIVAQDDASQDFGYLGDVSGAEEIDVGGSDLQESSFGGHFKDVEEIIAQGGGSQENDDKIDVSKDQFVGGLSVVKEMDDEIDTSQEIGAQPNALEDSGYLGDVSGEEDSSVDYFADMQVNECEKCLEYENKNKAFWWANPYLKNRPAHFACVDFDKNWCFLKRVPRKFLELTQCWDALARKLTKPSTLQEVCAWMDVGVVFEVEACAGTKQASGKKWKRAQDVLREVQVKTLRC